MSQNKGLEKNKINIINPVDNVTRRIHQAVIAISILLLIFLTSWLIHSYPSSLQLHFNFYGLLSFIALITNLVAFFLIIRIKVRTDTMLWFTIFLLSLAVWAGTTMMIGFSETKAAASFWSPISTLGAVFMPVALYLFVLSYTNPKRITSPFVFPMMAGVSALTVYIDSHTPLMHNYNANAMISRPWGFIAPTGPAFFIISFWLTVLCLGSITLLLRFRRTTANPELRNQAKLFSLAIAIPLSIGAFTDGIFPGLNINILPPLAVPLLSVTGIIISYGIIKHQFLSLTPDLIANEVLNTINEAVIGISPDLHLSYFNIGAERLLGRQANELTNMVFSDILAEQWSEEEIKQKIFFPLSKGEFYTIDAVRFRTTADKPVTTKLSITKVDSEDRSYGYLLVLTDITAIVESKAIIEQQVTDRTKQLHNEKAKLLSSIESLNIGFLLIDIGGVISTKNDAINRILGFSKEDSPTVKQFEEQFSTLDFNDITKELQTGKSVTLNDVPLGSKILKLFIGPVIADRGTDHQQTIATVVMVEDITEATIQARSRDEFFSIASHELRTPLTSIKGNASLILNYYQEILKDVQLKEMVQDIHKSSSRLIAIVNDFLDVSRLEQGKVSFNYKGISVGKIIENVAYEMKSVLDEKNLFLDVDKPSLDSLPLVWADEDRLKQIVYNLVGNASKFTETGGITISGAPNNNFIQVFVADTGHGMTKESQELLFRKFQQATSSLITRDTTAGTGLGLYISKMIIESMGGNISLVNSTVNVGTTFSFNIPIATDEQKKSKPQAATTSTDLSTGLTITTPTN